MHRAFGLLLSLALALTPVLGSAQSFEVPTSMRVALISPPDLDLYPLRLMDRDMVSLLGLVYESLIVLDDSRQPVEGLGVAESWEQFDSRTWDFTIRQGVTFHDGLELTAYDIAATMDAIKRIAEDETLADNEKGLYTNLVNICSSWSAQSAYQLRITTAYPFYGVLYALTFPILQAQSVMNPSPPGTGPYRILSYMPGEEVWLGGVENWYAGAPHVKEIVGRFYTTAEDAMLAYEAEDVDIVMTRSLGALRYRGTASSRANSYDYSTQQLECLIINNGQRNPNLGERDMREAIVRAINTQKLITNIYQGMVSTTTTIQSPKSWLNDESLEPYGYNPDRSREILDALGWNNFNDQGQRIRRTETGETKLLEVRLNYYDESGNSLRKEAANEIAQMLRAVGFRVRVGSYTFENAAQKLSSGDFDLFLCAYNFDTVPDPNFVLLSTGRGNYARFRNEDMTALCQALRKASTATEFKAIWDDIQALMLEEIAFLPLYWRNGIILTRYAYSNIRDIREFELLRSLNQYR